MITYETEMTILELSEKKYKKNDIAKMCNVSRASVFNVLKKYRVPLNDYDSDKKEKKSVKFTDLLSLRLLYFCNDYEILSKMFVYNFLHFQKNTKKIYVDSRLKKIVSIKKIEKIIKISQSVGLQFAVA